MPFEESTKDLDSSELSLNTTNLNPESSSNDLNN